MMHDHPEFNRGTVGVPVVEHGSKLPDVGHPHLDPSPDNTTMLSEPYGVYRVGVSDSPNFEFGIRGKVDAGQSLVPRAVPRLKCVGWRLIGPMGVAYKPRTLSDGAECLRVSTLPRAGRAAKPSGRRSVRANAEIVATHFASLDHDGHPSDGVEDTTMIAQCWNNGNSGPICVILQRLADMGLEPRLVP